MTDPAVAYVNDGTYGPFDRGIKDDIFLKAANGSSPFLGAVWPGKLYHYVYLRELISELLDRCYGLPW